MRLSVASCPPAPTKEPAAEGRVEKTTLPADTKKDSCCPSDLRCVPMLAALPEATLAQLAAGTERKCYDKHDQIIGPGDAPAILMVRRGAVRLGRYGPDGAYVASSLYGGGAMIGLLLLNPAVAPASVAEALLDETVIDRIDGAHFRAVMRADPTLFMAVTDELCLRLGNAMDRAAEMRFLTVRARVAKGLVYAIRVLGNPITITHDDLAGLAATTREEVTRTLKHFRARGLVESPPHRSAIFVPSVERLLEEANVSEGM